MGKERSRSNRALRGIIRRKAKTLVPWIYSWFGSNIFVFVANELNVGAVCVCPVQLFSAVCVLCLVKHFNVNSNNCEAHS